VSAFGLLGVYRLASDVSNRKIAIASVICVALYPTWFAQSSMAHMDLAVATFVTWGLWAYLRKSTFVAGLFFTMAALTKETAIVVPLAIWFWDVAQGLKQRRSSGASRSEGERAWRDLHLTLLAPI